jgi:hypothetical protein
MKFVFVLCVVAAVFATEVALQDDASESEMAVHYAALSKVVSRDAELLSSARLAEIDSHLAIVNPMKKIYSTCQQMQTQIYAERKAAMDKERSDKSMCSSTLASYQAGSMKNNNNKKNSLDLAANHRKLHLDKKDEPKRLANERTERNGTIAKEEADVFNRQESRNKEHTEFVNLKESFEYALGNVSLIRRVLNGEGTLTDLHGAYNLVETESCSAHMSNLAEALSHTPQVASMLQVFSKSFALVENSKVAKVGGGVQAKSQSNKGDMDAINTILDKVRENLEKSLTLAHKQENAAIALWKNTKQTMTNNINKNYLMNWKNYKEGGEVEEYMGLHWETEGKHRVSARRSVKRRDELDILHEFLNTRCKDSRRAYVTVMASYTNELNALDKVIKYLTEKVFPKWSKMMSIQTVTSSPYQWKSESKPAYVDVKAKNTFSTTAYNNGDDVQCRTPYSTVFSKIRILTQDRTNQKFLDPNDLSHSSNVNLKRTSVLKSIQCQLFPDGIPVGRAHSCDKLQYATAQVDLTGTGYKFGKKALQMFKILGRQTLGSAATLSKDGLVLKLSVRGRCGDLYGDDAQLDDADYRSDPIPLEKA